ncbi:MAG TPA: MBL fold metallo-hydrolase [Pyrinomonadaceae bacterium]|jgi:beta-lactamase superfamily II metal-dependent hydrolase|nr:MBL fold metallo-hydrolase [Pyrinomonadaceae bacterium]
MRFFLFLATIVLFASTVHAAPRTLDIYFIDTEGGAATLIVTPGGESLLVDSGNPGERDAGRIARVARDVAKLQQIDYYLTTHWHSDHVGGIGPLAKLIPVKNFYDHGFVEPLPDDINRELMTVYKQVSAGKQIVVRPGDELKFARKTPAPLRLRVLAANGTVLGEQSAAPQVRPCGENFVAAPEDTSDNARSVVFLLTYGNFKFFDGGDLTWNVEDRLACPKNLAGPVDVFQVNHHGLGTSNNPRLVAALAPRVAIINNGARKGGAARTFATLKESVAADRIFQLHRNVATTDADNAPPANVANDAEACQGEYVKLSVDARGRSYVVTVPGKGTTHKFQTK